MLREDKMVKKSVNPVAAIGPRLVKKKVSDRGAVVQIQNVRIIWPQIAKPSQGRDNIAPSFGVTALVPKKDANRIIAEAKKIAEEMLRASTFPEKKRVPALARSFKFHDHGSLFKDGDKQEKADGTMRKETQGHVLLKMTSKVDPESVANGEAPRPRFPFELKDKKNQPIPAHLIEQEFYGGAWCDLTFTLAPYDTAGNVGISAFFNGAMKLVNDERLGGAENFSEARDDIPDEEENFDGAASFDGGGEEPEPVAAAKPAKGKRK